MGNNISSVFDEFGVNGVIDKILDGVFSGVFELHVYKNKPHELSSPLSKWESCYAIDEDEYLRLFNVIQGNQFNIKD